MPQYTRMQYGQTQYGLFLPKKTPGLDNLVFQKARMGLLINGTMTYIYQHTPVEVKGPPKKMRFKGNTGETFYKEDVSVHAHSTLFRLKSNTSSDWLLSQRNEQKGGTA